MPIRRHRSGRMSGSWETTNDIKSEEDDAFDMEFEFGGGDGGDAMFEYEDEDVVREESNDVSSSRKRKSDDSGDDGDDDNDAMDDAKKRRKTAHGGNNDNNDNNDSNVDDGGGRDAGNNNAISMGRRIEHNGRTRAVQEPATTTTPTTVRPSNPPVMHNNFSAAAPMAPAEAPLGNSRRSVDPTERTDSTSAATSHTVTSAAAAASPIITQHRVQPNQPISAVANARPSRVNNGSIVARDNARRRTRPIPRDATEIILQQYREEEGQGISDQMKIKKIAKQNDSTTYAIIRTVITGIIAIMLFATTVALIFGLSNPENNFVTTEDLSRAVASLKEELHDRYDTLSKLHDSSDDKSLLQALNDDIAQLRLQMHRHIKSLPNTRDGTSTVDFEKISVLEKRLESEIETLNKDIHQLQSSIETKRVDELKSDSEKHEEQLRNIEKILHSMASRLDTFAPVSSIEDIANSLSAFEKELNDYVNAKITTGEQTSTQVQAQVQELVNTTMAQIVEKLNPLSERVRTVEDTLDLHVLSIKYDSSVTKEISPEFRVKIAELVQEYIASDIVGKSDFALRTMGAEIIAHSPSYRWENKELGGGWLASLFHRFQHGKSNQPSTLLTPDLSLGRCWAFDGAHGFVLIRLPRAVSADSFSVDHIHRTIALGISTAPRHFVIRGFTAEQKRDALEYASELNHRIRNILIDKNWQRQNMGEITDREIAQGQLLAEFEYDTDGPVIQTFRSHESGRKPFLYFLVEILENHGSEYTCIYRFRIHGSRSRA